MRKSFMEYQRERDHAAEVELRMECIEQGMRELLMAGKPCEELPYRDDKTRRQCVMDCGPLDVINAMVDLDEEAFNSAIFLTQTDPIAAAEQLGALMKRAVEQVIGLAPIREAAEFEEREEAA